MTERPTIKDVARAAGVSPATASRALSGSRPVHAHLRERVRIAASQLEYNPNLAARALRSAKTGAIGMVVPMIDNPFFPSLVSAAESLLQEQGYSLLLCSSQDDVDLEAQRIRALTERQVDGLLISAASRVHSAGALSRAAELVPVVLLDQCTDDVDAPFVGVDDVGGMHDLIEHLVARGRRRMAFIGASDENWSGMRRRHGFEQYAAAVDPRCGTRMRLGTFTRDYGRSAAHDLLEQDPRIDALVCANDLIALGALDAARERSLTVPDDLAVTGFDDIDVATASTPRLTTVSQPVPQIAATGVQILLSAVVGEREPASLTELRGSLVVREST